MNPVPKVTKNPSNSAVGRLLQYWRQARRKSQLALALDAGVSARHLSFVESGRAVPSREMLQRLANALEMPFRERNALLTAAGYAQIYRETGLAQPELAQARKAIGLILEHQEPYPAVVMDRHWNLLDSNNAAKKLFGILLSDSVPPEPPNVLRLMFHPGGLRPWVSNWKEAAGALIQRVHREALGGLPDQTTQKLLDEIAAYPGVPGDFCAPDLQTPLTPLLPVRFRKGRLAADFFSTVTTLGTPLDITLQEIRIECFFPADEPTELQARSGYGGI